MFRFKVYRYDPAVYKHVDREDRSIIYTGKKTRFNNCILIYVINRIGRLYIQDIVWSNHASCLL